jgi:hypothetical protein
VSRRSWSSVGVRWIVCEWTGSPGPLKPTVFHKNSRSFAVTSVETRMARPNSSFLTYGAGYGKVLFRIGQGRRGWGPVRISEMRQTAIENGINKKKCFDFGCTSKESDRQPNPKYNQPHHQPHKCRRQIPKCLASQGSRECILLHCPKAAFLLRMKHIRNLRHQIRLIPCH